MSPEHSDDPTATRSTDASEVSEVSEVSDDLAVRHLLSTGTSRVVGLAAAVGTSLGRRARGAYRVDQWGLDEGVFDTLAPLARLRWAVELTGGSNLPRSAPCVLVHNQRFGLSEPLVAASAVYRATQRRLRVVAPTGLPVLGPTMRRFGAVGANAADIGSLLRAGAIVSVSAQRNLLTGAPGTLDATLLDPACVERALVIPVAVLPAMGGLRWQVSVGQPVTLPRRSGPLAAAHLAEQVQAELADLARR